MQLNFAHLCIKTKDLAKTEHFYTQILGMKKVFTFYRGDKTIGYYFGMGSKQFIEVFEAPEVEHGPSAMLHLCLETGDIDQAQAELKKHGVSTTEKLLGADNSYQIWFKDPNGIDIELHQYTDKSTQLTGQDVTVNW